MSDTEKNISEQLKEILPHLVNAKEQLAKVDKLAEGKEEQAKQIKDFQEQLKNIEGTVTDLGKKTIKLANREVNVKNSGLSKEQKIDFAKYLIHIYKNAANPSQAYVNSIKEIQDKYEMKALSEGTTTAGGYGVPELFSGMIWREVEQESIFLREATKIPLTVGYKLPIINKNAGITIAWEDEAADFNSSDPSWTKSTTSALKMAAYTQMSNELLEDEEFDPGLTDYVIQLYSEAMATEIDDQGFNGDGTQFTGVLRESGTNAVTMASGLGKFSDITFDHLSEMIAQIKPGSLRNAKFYMHRTILDKLRQLKGSDNYYWKQVSAATPATIHGYPVVSAEEMPTNSETAVSTAFVVFGNLKYYAIGTKGEMTVQVGRELKMLSDSTVIAIRRRIAMKTAVPGAFAKLVTNAVDS